MNEEEKIVAFIKRQFDMIERNSTGSGADKFIIHMCYSCIQDVLEGDI